MGSLLKVYPIKAILEPASNLTVMVSLNVEKSELRDILSVQEIRKMATLSVVTGDEPSRQLLRRYTFKYYLPAYGYIIVPQDGMWINPRAGMALYLTCQSS